MKSLGPSNDDIPEDEMAYAAARAKSARARSVRMADPQRQRRYLENVRHWHEQRPDYGKQYYAKNRDYLLAISKERRASNLECAQQYKRKWVRLNRERVREHNARFYEANREQEIARTRDYMARNPEAAKIRADEARMRRRNQIADSTWDAVAAFTHKGK